MRPCLTQVAAIALTVAGCGGGDQFPVASTTGRVVCEGQPLPKARVFFEPLQTGDSARVGKQGLAIADADGRFVVSTYGANDGAVVAKHRVRVDRPGDPDEQPPYRCPCVLNSELDVMEVDVKARQKNEFEVVLKKKTGQEKAPLHD